MLPALTVMYKNKQITALSASSWHLTYTILKTFSIMTASFLGLSQLHWSLISFIFWASWTLALLRQCHAQDDTQMAANINRVQNITSKMYQHIREILNRCKTPNGQSNKRLQTFSSFSAQRFGVALSLHDTVRDLPHTVHTSNLWWWFAVPTAAHSRVSIFWTFKFFIWLVTF